MGDNINELKKRTKEDPFGDSDDNSFSVSGKESAKSPVQELKESLDSNPTLNPDSNSEIKPSALPNPPDSDSDLTPNPYEEKFHSEFSFMAFVLGIFGLILPLFSPLAIIFGIGGLMQTHRERMKGRWMAFAGIGLGFLGIIVMIIAIIFGIGFLEDYLLRMGGIETLVGNVGN